MKIYVVLGDCTECNGDPVAAFSSLEAAKREFPHSSIWGIEVDSSMSLDRYGSKVPTAPIEHHY